ncbi:MAG: DUF177 domain-containing protein [Bacteroidales bacterium]|nr:DUF177 domain-containing protein [Bacteroidales bacterium]MCL2133632.1 DUF177 domain-containing protein [Bacteroidales bacterium]
MKNVSNCIVAFKGLSDDKHSFRFEIGDSFFKLFEGSEIEHGSLSAEVLLDKQSACMQITVTINGTVDIACDRCLDNLILTVSTNGELAVRFGKSDNSNPDDDLIVLDPSEGEIDLSQYIYDSINVALPLQRIHTEGQCNPEMTEKLQHFMVN